MMLKLTWRNLWRNPKRTLITMASVTFAVMLAIIMQSLQKGVFDHLVKNVVSFYNGYIQIHKQGYHNEQVIDNSFEFDSSFLDRLQQNPGIKEAIPRLETFVLASMSNITKGCMLVGIDPIRENKLTQLKERVIKGNYFNEDDTQVALIAEGLARKLNIHITDTLVLLGQGYQGTLAAGKFKITGIAHFGSPVLNDAVVFLPLASAQSFLNAPDLITSFALAIDDPRNMLAIQQQVNSIAGKEYEVMNWEEQLPEIANHIKADTASFYVFNGILYLIIAFGIFGTIIMMTVERKYEFGMFVAIGMKKTRLAIMLLFETMLIALLGVLAGIILSMPLVWLLNINPIRLTGQAAAIYERFGFEALFPAALHAPIFIAQSFIVLVIALLIGLYPVGFVIKLNPVIGMKA
ncbi:MAG: ABC transporter permease [Bacteroidota bacterium]|nr:ABC transporter permease [Bacteroidota bacterium]